MPATLPVPCAVTIHDCTFFDHPEWHLRSKAAFFRRAIRHAARQAGVLICVSQVDRRPAARELRGPGTVVVAPHGVDLERFAPTEAAPGADRAELDALGLPTDRPLLAFVGTLEPRKGVAPLVAAFDRLAEAHPDLVLVLGGQLGLGDGRDRARPGDRPPPRADRADRLPARPGGACAAPPGLGRGATRPSRRDSACPLSRPWPAARRW